MKGGWGVRVGGGHFIEGMLRAGDGNLLACFSALGILIAPDDRQAKIWKRASSERSTNDSPQMESRYFWTLNIAKNTLYSRRVSTRNSYSELRNERYAAHQGLTERSSDLLSTEIAHIFSAKSFCEVIDLLWLSFTHRYAIRIARKWPSAQENHALNATITIMTKSLPILLISHQNWIRLREYIISSHFDQRCHC